MLKMDAKKSALRFIVSIFLGVHNYPGCSRVIGSPVQNSWPLGVLAVALFKGNGGTPRYLAGLGVQPGGHD